MTIPSAEPKVMANWSPQVRSRPKASATGRRGGRAPGESRGVWVRSMIPIGRSKDPSLGATLNVAAPWQALRGRAEAQPLILRATDIRDKVRMRPVRHLILFVVDASRSMGVRRRMAQTKGAVLSLLVDAYQKRDRVGLITFGGKGAELVLPPTRSVQVAARRLGGLPVGGLTPLAHGLAMAAEVVASARRRDPWEMPFVVLLTDGRGNVPLRPGGHPGSDALAMAGRLARSGVAGLVVDTEAGPDRLGLAGAIARAWEAELLPLDDLDGRRLPEAVRRALFSRTA